MKSEGTDEYSDDNYEESFHEENDEEEEKVSPSKPVNTRFVISKQPSVLAADQKLLTSFKARISPTPLRQSTNNT